MAKERQKRIGPARSASSMMRSSTRRNGFRTVIDFARMCAKLIPSSVRRAHQPPRAHDPTSGAPSSSGGSPSKPPVPNAVHQPPGAAMAPP
jgi:hypothetical protein